MGSINSTEEKRVRHYMTFLKVKKHFPDWLLKSVKPSWRAYFWDGRLIKQPSEKPCKKLGWRIKAVFTQGSEAPVLLFKQSRGLNYWVPWIISPESTFPGAPALGGHYSPPKSICTQLGGQLLYIKPLSALYIKNFESPTWLSRTKNTW